MCLFHLALLKYQCKTILFGLIRKLIVHGFLQKVLFKPGTLYEKKNIYATRKKNTEALI